MHIYAQLTRLKMNQIETIILEFFENYPEAKIVTPEKATKSLYLGV